MHTLIIHPRLDSFLKQVVNFYPKYVIDIGAHIGMWSRYTKSVFPNSNFFLIEANNDCKPDLLETEFDFEIALLAEENNISKTYYKINNGDSSGNSVYRERTTAYDDNNCTGYEIKTKTLDTILEQKNIEPDFLKLDVQGSELDVLKGATNTLQKVEFVLLEIEVAEFNEGAPSFFQILDFMDKKGFEIFDLIELKYMPHSLCLCNSQKGRLNEMDILFIKKGSTYKQQVDTKVGFVSH